MPERLFHVAPDVVIAQARWTIDGWTYVVHHRPSGALGFDPNHQLVVARLSTSELLDVVDATWADRLGITEA